MYARLTFLWLCLLSAACSLQAEVLIPEPLRGEIEVEQATIDHALALHEAGWRYVMPRPKSAKAAWGHGDKRTTWWIGYWKNAKTGVYSLNVPRRVENQYIPHGSVTPGWRRGGTPPRPTKLQWLLSDSGGVKPYD